MNGSRSNRMAYQTEWHTFELNGSQMNGPPRMEFWTTLKEPGIDYGRLIQSSADETGSSWRTSCLYNSETHCSMCRGNFSPTCRMNCLNLLYSISAATNLSSLTCFFFGNPFFFKNTEFLIEYSVKNLQNVSLCLKDLQT